MPVTANREFVRVVGVFFPVWRHERVRGKRLGRGYAGGGPGSGRELPVLKTYQVPVVHP